MVAAKSVVNSAIFRTLFAQRGLLNVARFPNMGFVSTSIEKRKEGVARVTGDLTMLA